MKPGISVSVMGMGPYVAVRLRHRHAQPSRPIAATLNKDTVQGSDTSETTRFTFSGPPVWPGENCKP